MYQHNTKPSSMNKQQHIDQVLVRGPTQHLLRILLDLYLHMYFIYILFLKHRFSILSTSKPTTNKEAPFWKVPHVYIGIGAPLRKPPEKYSTVPIWHGTFQMGASHTWEKNLCHFFFFVRSRSQEQIWPKSLRILFPALISHVGPGYSQESRHRIFKYSQI